jgi:hypothetical protein
MPAKTTPNAKRPEIVKKLWPNHPRELLRMMWPNTTQAVIDEALQVENRPVHIVVTTMPSSTSIYLCLEWLLQQGGFVVTVVCPEDSPASFIQRLRCHGCEVRTYPTRYRGLYKTRVWLEKTFPIPFCIMDDDMGSVCKGTYRFRPPWAIFPNEAIIAGAHREGIPQDLFRWLVNIAIYFGNKSSCAYSGFSGSSQNTTSLPGYEVRVGIRPTRSFGTYGRAPFCYDTGITGFQIVLCPIRSLVSDKLRDVHQEFATSCITAIGEGLGGTLSILSVVVHFSVNSPEDAEGDIRRLADAYPGTVERGNSAGGRDNSEKTGCIVRLKTRLAYSNPRGAR